MSNESSPLRNLLTARQTSNPDVPTPMLPIQYEDSSLDLSLELLAFSIRSKLILLC